MHTVFQRVLGGLWGGLRQFLRQMPQPRRQKRVRWQAACRNTIMDPVGAYLVVAFAGFQGSASNPTAAEIVTRSTANARASWDAFPDYSYIEREVLTRGDRRKVTTYDVRMIDGSPYNNVVAVDDELVPLDKQQRRLHAEIDRRQKESPDQRQQRIAKYQRERRQDHALLAEMINGFDFTLSGDEVVNGRLCYVLDANPHPGFHPASRETKVLKGMRGKMWVDEDQFQWVRVQAEVFRKVSFGLFIASVRPGTEFVLEMSPIIGGVWLPTHFAVHVKSSVLLWSRESMEDDYYSDYHALQ